MDINFAADDDQGRAPANFGKNYARQEEVRPTQHVPHQPEHQALASPLSRVASLELASPPCGEVSRLAFVERPRGLRSLKSQVPLVRIRANGCPEDTRICGIDCH